MSNHDDFYSWLSSPMWPSSEPDEDKDENGKKKDLVSSLKNRQKKVAKAISKQERELSRITQLIELLSGDSETAKQIMDQMEHLDLLK